jgi:hypothetical protein
MRRAIVLTTIRVPECLRGWRELLRDDDAIIVAGDLKTPHDEVALLLRDLPGLNVYLHPDFQEDYNKELSDCLGWNTIARRNMALLMVYQNPTKYDYIYELDDDNFVHDSQHFYRLDQWFNNLVNASLVSTKQGFWNAGQLCTPQVTLRGYPATLRNKVHQTTFSKNYSVNVGVVQSLCLGDPDVDGVQRLCCNRRVSYIRPDSTVLERGTWCPFNSQATAFRTDLAPLMAVWPFVGRYDDIWASYLAQAVMPYFGYHVAYGHPVVVQERNTSVGWGNDSPVQTERNHVQDIENELLGLKYTEALCATLRQTMPQQTIPDMMAGAVAKLAGTGFVPERTIIFLNSWVRAVCGGTSRSSASAS